MSTTPFIDMSPDDIKEFPDCDERAVLLAALQNEETAHENFGWCNTNPVLFQYLFTASIDVWPAAAYHPVELHLCETVTEQIAAAAERLTTDREARKRLRRERSKHLGVGLVQEIIVCTADQRKRARQVFGVFATGEPFRVRRVRGAEPTVSFAFSVVAGADAGLFRAMADLNDAFNDAHRRGTEPAA